MTLDIPITTVYTGACGFLYLVLSLRVIHLRLRKTTKISDKLDKTLYRAIRGHSNFQEYTPTVLFMLALAEGQQLVAPRFLHLFGSAFLLGRISHASYFTLNTPSIVRTIGMAPTLAALTCLSAIFISTLM